MMIQLTTRIALLLLLILSASLGFSQDFQSSSNKSSFDSQSSLNDLLEGDDAEDDLSDILSQSEDFLPVHEAYRLSVTLNEQQLIAEWVIADKYFLYGEQFKFFINANGQQKPLEAKLPVGLVQYDEIFEKNVEKHYYNAQAVIDRTQLPTDSTVTLSVTSQGCADAGLCYPPDTQFFTINPVTNSVSPSEPPTTLSSGLSNSNYAPPSGGLWFTLLMMLFAIIGGAILNLMPCVFPVLSIKALSIANAGQDQQHQRRHGWSYTFGVISTFLLVASALLIVRETGEAAGWGFQLQSPGFITLLIYLFFVMGLSLSGYITFGTSLMGAGQQLTQGSDLKHSFFTGALAAIVASPCTAPFMASALGYALTQPAPVALGIFAALGFGMALPFLLLSHLPNLGERLPQPGPWMETLKQALAFPLYITAIWLAWVLGRQVSSDAIALVLLGAVLIVFATWMRSHRYALSQTVVAVTLVGIALIAWKNNQPRIHNEIADGIWESYSPERLAEFRQQGTPVFINLTADWCITCIANEKLVFTDNTLAKMQDNGIQLIKGDWTNYDQEITQLLERYGRGGVPLYLLYPAEPNGDAQVLPQILTPNLFHKELDKITATSTKLDEVSYKTQ